MKTTAVLALALTSVLAVSACGSSGNDKATDKPSASPSSTSNEIISPAHLPTPPSFANGAKGVYSDITVASCDTKPGPVTAKGTAKNSGKFTRSIVVTMNWAAPTGGDVVARGVAVMKDVAPGKTVNWSVKATIKDNVSVQCVPTAQAGQLKS